MNLLRTVFVITLFLFIVASAEAQRRICLVGDASRYGWDKSNSSPLIRDSGNVAVFYFNAWLNSGEFKFVFENQDSWVPSWNKGANDSTLFKRLTYGDPDVKFSISTAGNYAITIDTTLLTIRISPMQDPGMPPVSLVKITTDKAMYSPGAQVIFSIDQTIPESVKVRYRHLDMVVSEMILTGTNWVWTAPPTDFTGYMVDIYKVNVDGTEHVYGSIAVDVSSDWTRFPRYGFLSRYPQLTDLVMDSVIGNLCRHHINGLQFYDWHLAHHKPLSGTTADPDPMWLDIANRETYFSTVSGYIQKAHNRNIKAMFYNLCYGALNTAAGDGVQNDWYMFTDAAHTHRDSLALPSPAFNSDIWLLNPANTAWQQYIVGRNDDVYQVFDFDGYHIDQLGNRNNTLYTYAGQVINLETSFGTFINAMKADQPGKKHVLNAVNQYGQQNISSSPVDFLYTEVWSPNDGYNDLATIIKDNGTFSNNTKNTVLAAYLNYDLADTTGYFNTPGVLLGNAVIFSFGGAHLELGEHMLCREYFPNNNLQMTSELRDAMVGWYDFLVAYENLLRDGGTFNSPTIICTDYQFTTKIWPPQIGKVSVSGRMVGIRQVIHLINFSNANTLNWRDPNGTQTTPATYQQVQLKYTTNATVQKIWMASPDINKGTPQLLNFSQSSGSVYFTIPSLKYWNMIVVE